jgi:hypothetical protein
LGLTRSSALLYHWKQQLTELGALSGLKEVIWMTWETPTFVEVKMDAEVNSYQEDYEGI